MGMAMEVTFDRFPVFEANQVLTSGHLNDVFDYLDQQTRQTRADLIGIGIVCGFDVKLDTSSGVAVHVSKGCGVASEGYLIVEPEDVTLTTYRDYVLPTDLAYSPFHGLPLWELFPNGEKNTTPLGSPSGFLDDKAILLFLELKKQGLRNCSPNNCDDKGAEVTANVRRLMMGRKDLDKVIAAANGLGSGLTTSDIDVALSAKLNLPDLRAQRFDIVNSSPATSGDVYGAFLNTFRATKLVQATGNALGMAYRAFQPLLQASYPASPFTDFATTFGFLDSAPTNTTQVRFLQYYADLFEDLVCAYDEFRWKGAELVCACCPNDGLFPRHLMLGLLQPESVAAPGHYRQAFLASPAVSDCDRETKEVLQLFSRLVEMALRFSVAPSLPKSNNAAGIDPQIRVTPSTLDETPLSAKAIPYYYQQNGTPPLYRLWSGEKTRRNRANQNLSYRSDEYSPAAPAFVTDPLRYDIERYNFLRIEGHLGKDYQRVLGTLLSLKSQYRLPIDVIALRTGAYDDTQPVDLTDQPARFQDLQSLYDSLREELESALAEGIRELYDTPATGIKLPGGTPELPLLKAYAPNYRYSANTIGAWYEKYLKLFQARAYIDVDQEEVDPTAVMTVYCSLFTGTSGLQEVNYPHVVSIYYLDKLSEILPASLDALAYADFENKYEDLLALLRYFRSDALKKVPSDLKAFVPAEEFIDLCDQILFNCKLKPVKAVHAEYVRRIGELRKRQFLSNFLPQHPGIQHKAGVPLGGTFIVVYHRDPAQTRGATPGVISNLAVLSEALAPGVKAKVAVSPRPPAEGAGISTTTIAVSERFALSDAIRRIGSNHLLAQNPDINLVLGSLTGKIPIFVGERPTHGLDEASSKIISAAVAELADGEVIADFYLPYRVSCDCPGIQYVLPKSPPTFTATVGCTDPSGSAGVTIDARGGVGPYDVSVDQGAYRGLSGPLHLQVGTHSLRLRDAESTEASPKSVTVAPPLVIGTPTYRCADSKFTATFTISGGTPPYTVNGKPVAASGDTFTSDPAASGAQVPVEVLDAKSCSVEAEFTHVCPPPCTLPCKGIALKRGYRFWLPDADASNAYRSAKITVSLFSVEASSGKSVDLTKKVQKVLTAKPADLSEANFSKLTASWVAKINGIIAAEPGLNEAGKASWLTLGYEKAGPGRLGVLWIEYFECLKFDIRIKSTFVRASGSDTLGLDYAPKDTTILANDATTRVPAFGGTKADKCNPDRPAEPLCPKPPAIALKIAASAGRGRTMKLHVSTRPSGAGLVFVWEVQGASPPMGNGATFTTTLTRTSPGRRLITVTAFTKAGCTVTQSQLLPAPVG